MATHPHYPNLYEGPLVDGEQTWFCWGKHIPQGAARRFRGEGWARSYRPDDDRVYQVKNVQLPDPEGWKQPDGSIVTLAKHMRGRVDQRSWEWCNADGLWRPFAGRLEFWDGDDFAVHVRRIKR